MKTANPLSARAPAVALAPRAERIEPQLSDALLLERLGRGDAWAKEALYRRYVGQVWSTALRLLGNTQDAEDVVQDTFADALRDLPKLGRVDALSGWLLQVAVHQAHRRFRRRSLLRRLGFDRSVDDASLASLADPSASAEVHAELTRVDRALAELPVGERFAWSLRYVGGHSLNEVAALCRCSLPTAKRRIARANQCVAKHRAESPTRAQSETAERAERESGVEELALPPCAALSAREEP